MQLETFVNSKHLAWVSNCNAVYVVIDNKQLVIVAHELSFIPHLHSKKAPCPVYLETQLRSGLTTLLETKPHNPLQVVENWHGDCFQ